MILTSVKKCVDAVVPIDFMLPGLIHFALGLIAGQGFVYTLTVFLLLPVVLLIGHVICVQNNSRSKFFHYWLLNSILFIFVVYQFDVISRQIQFKIEIVIYVSSLAATLYLLLRVRSLAKLSYAKEVTQEQLLQDMDLEAPDRERYCAKCQKQLLLQSSHCKICNRCVMNRHIHCIWFDCCISRRNYSTYLTTLASTTVSLALSSYLMLTAVCVPTLLFDMILFPDDCSDVYEGNFVIFVCGIYCLVMMTLPLTMFCLELWVYFTDGTADDLQVIPPKSKKKQIRSADSIK